MPSVPKKTESPMLESGTLKIAGSVSFDFMNVCQPLWAQTLSPILNSFELLLITIPAVSPVIGSPIFAGAA